jgi:hypothetical protein
MYEGDNDEEEDGNRSRSGIARNFFDRFLGHIVSFNIFPPLDILDDSQTA